MTLVDNATTGIYHTTKAYCSQLVSRLSGLVEGTTVMFDSVEDVLNASGYSNTDLICVAPPTLEFERNTTDDSDVLLLMRFTVGLFCERARGNEGDAIPDVVERMYEMLDGVLPVLVSSDIHGYQLLIDTAYPVSRSEMTQKQYTIECTLSKQTEYEPCL